MNNPVKF